MNIILHIGLPKTGTSSIQNWALGRSQYLRSCGLYVLPTVMSAHRIAGEFVKDAKRAGDDDVTAIRQYMPLNQVEDELKFAANDQGVTCAFVSSEYFYICDNIAVADFFKSLNFNVLKVIAYVRRQDLLASSGYNQDVKAMRASEPFVVGDFRPDYDYYALADSWQAAFPDATVQLRNFDLLAESGSVICQLATDIGYPSAYEPSDEGDYRTNDSLSAELLEIVRTANALGRFEISGLAVEAQSDGMRGPHFLLNRSIRQEILSMYSESNHRLAKYLGPDYEEFTELDKAEGLDCTHDFPIKTAVELMSYAIKKLGPS